MSSFRPRLKSLAAAAIAIVTIFSTNSYAQQEDDQQQPGRRSGIPTEGFWPTQAMLDRAFERIVRDMSRDYGFDDQQREMATELVRDTLTRYLNENRDEIQALMNRYIEAVMNEDAPAPDDVATWSQRALPLVNKFRAEVDTMAERMRGFLTEDQQYILDGNIAAFHTGMDFGTQRLQSWAAGEYDPETEWIRNPGVERRERERLHEVRRQMLDARRQAITQATGQPAAEPFSGAATAAEARPVGATSKPAAPPDDWERYVEQFVRKYDLNEDQRQRAFQFLTARQRERDQQLKRRGPQMERIEKLYKEAKTPEEVARAEAEFEKLNAPIERIFDNLKRQLDTLPTREQRRKADGDGGTTAEPKK